MRRRLSVSAHEAARSHGREAPWPCDRERNQIDLLRCEQFGLPVTIVIVDEVNIVL